VLTVISKFPKLNPNASFHVILTENLVTADGTATPTAYDDKCSEL
jgi:hypothetical protein